ncbi:MAG: hypothetical protein LIO91_07830 [Bacteroidales bacterium]|nr:hypothetical protein [Bacteroidales bacterium]
MNTIPLPQLVELLALATNTSEETARAFLTSLWDVIGQALADGRQAKIKGIGTFTLGGLNGDQLQFVPDEGLAEAVNSSFSFFEPMPLEDGIDETMLQEETPEEAIQEAAEEVTVEAPKEAVEEVVEEVAEKIPEESPEEASEEVVSPQGDTAIMRYSDNAKNQVTSADDGRPRPALPRRPHPLIPLAVGLVAGFALGFFIPWHGGSQGQEGMDAAAPVDSVEVVEEEFGDTTWVDEATVMEDSLGNVESLGNIENIGHSEVAEETKVTYDTIGARRFLTTMARKYYGRYEFWPYIYKENEDKLGHPDRIAPGTVVVIPPAEKYGINPDDPESLKAASKLNAEIYARFGR